MYYLNLNLLENLPALLGLERKTIEKQYGLGRECLTRWIGGAHMSVEKFVDMCNKLHISMASFLVTVPKPIIYTRKEDYIIPDEIWKPIVWNNEKIKNLYGKGSFTGIPSIFMLSKKLGLSSHAVANRWIVNSSAMDMYQLVDMLNKMELDANDFILDSNRLISVPNWNIGKNPDKSFIKVLDSQGEKIKELKRQLSERDALITKLLLDRDRLEKENKTLRLTSNKTASPLGLAAEESVSYKTYSTRKKIVFNKVLLQELPNIFGMTQRDFCNLYGIYPAQINGGNIKMARLIHICNGLHISVSHFFLPEGEPQVANHRGWYEISPKLFKPISGRMDNLKYIFKKETFGYTKEQCCQMSGLSHGGFHSFMKEDGKSSMVLTVVDICNSFNLPISVFVDDPNDRKRPAYSVSQNETLIENCVNIFKELERCRKKIKKIEEEEK